jgi:hypothetical protein
VSSGPTRTVPVRNLTNGGVRDDRILIRYDVTATTSLDLDEDRLSVVGKIHYNFIKYLDEDLKYFKYENDK